MEPVVRPAVPKDASHLSVRLEAARDALLALRGGPQLAQQIWGQLHEPSTITDAADVICGSSCVTFVGMIDGLDVGMAVAIVGGATMTVLGCFVDPQARGVGVGSALVQCLCEAAVSTDMTSIDAYALPGDRLTKQLYESCGLKARQLTMSKDLSEK